MLCLTTLICAMMLPALSSAITLDRPLTISSRGADVTALQQILFTLGYFKYEITGYFGQITHASVAAFQVGNGLEPVGSVGPKTRGLVNALLNAQSPTPPPMPTLPAMPAPAATSSPSLPLSPTATSTATTVTLESTTVSVDEPPVITVLTPPLLPTNTREVTLTIATDRNATCRFGTLANMEFGRKTAFQNTGGTTHTHDFINLSNGSLYIYYVQCEDGATLKITSDVIVSLTVAAHASSLPAMPSQLASAIESVSAIKPWSLMNPLQIILRALGL